MSEVKDKALVHRYYEEVLNQCQLHVIDELADPDFVSYLADGNNNRFEYL
jgi:hypothetical protein